MEMDRARTGREHSTTEAGHHQKPGKPGKTGTAGIIRLTQAFFTLF
jgi:hypothetical protein